jgi:hypothetical protein
MAIQDKVKKEDLDKMITKKVEEVMAAKEVKEEEKVVRKLISDKVEQILNKILDEEVRFMFLQGIFSLQCDLTEDDLGKKYYAWYSDDSKWNIKRIIKRLKQSKAKVTETNVKIPTVDFAAYCNKSEVMEYMAEEVYKGIESYNAYAKQVLDSNDVLNYEFIKEILICKYHYFKDLQECIESCSYKDKKVTITIDKDWYSNSINRIQIEAPVDMTNVEKY